MSLIDVKVSVPAQRVDQPGKKILLEAHCPICDLKVWGETMMTLTEMMESGLTLKRILTHRVTAIEIKMLAEWRGHLAQHIAEDQMAPIIGDTIYKHFRKV